MGKSSRKNSVKNKISAIAPPDDRQLSRSIFNPTITKFVGVSWILLAAIANRDKLLLSLRAALSIFAFSQYLAWPNLDHGISLLMLCGLFGVALSAGRPVLRILSDDEMLIAEELIFSLGLGLGLISLAVLLLGIVGHFSVTAIRWGLTALGMVSLALNIFFVPLKNVSGTVSRGLPSRWLAPTSCILAGLILLNLLSAMGPEVHYDALIYHLALPKLYLLNGRIFPTPYNVYSGMPFNAEMLYGVGLALGGESVAKLIPWGIGIAILGLIFPWVKRQSTADTALLATLMFYSFPIVADATWHCYVELPWCFFGLLAVAAATINPDPSRLTNRRVVLIGLFAGFCAGTKYTALAVTVLIVGIFIAKAARKEIGWKRLCAMTSILLLTTGLVLAPWIIKNFIFYRNPVFPFFNDRFPGAPQSIDWRGLVADAGGRDLRRTFTTVGGLLSLFSSLWPVINTNDQMSLGYGFYFFLPWIFLQRWRTTPYRDISIALFLGFAEWTFHTTMYRFFIFALPLVAILIATAITNWQVSERLRNWIYLCAVSSCLLNSAQTFRLWLSYRTWEVVFGQVQEKDFLSHEQPVYPAPPYPGIAFINKQLPLDSKILFLYEARTFRCERNFIASSPFAENPIVQMANESRNADELADRFRALGITHIFVNQQELYRLRTNLPFSPAGKSVIDDFLKKHVKLIFENKVETPGDLQWETVSAII